MHNQEDHLRAIITEYESALAKIPNPHELILVENASRDRTLEVAMELARQFPLVRVLRSERRGWGLAVKLGLSQAKGEYLCYTNSARTAPQDLALLLIYALVYPDVVIKANRKIRDSFYRRLGSLIYNLECRALFDLANWDINGTPKIFPRTFGKLMEFEQEGDLIDAEFSIICRREGYPIVEVPIFSVRRHGGRSTTNHLSALRMYWGALRLRMSSAKRPI